MRRFLPLLITAALVAAPTAASARAHFDDYDKCATTTGYSVRLDRGEAIFTKRGGHEIRFDAGRLMVDGREIALNAADRARIAEYARTLETVIPEVRAIAVEAVGIAFHAVSEVARTLLDSAGADATIARLSEKHAALVARIDDTFLRERFDEVAFEAMIEQTMVEMVPEVVSLAAGAAVRAALTGEAVAGDLEKRAAELEKTIEREVEARAEGLERRAEALCGTLEKLDALESAVTVQIDGEPFDLIELR